MGDRGIGNRDLYPKDVLSLVLSNLTIAAGVVYTSGWVYLRSYYDFFGVDLSVMEFAWNETLIYSISVIAYIVRGLLSWQAAVCVAVIVIAALAVRTVLPGGAEKVAAAAWQSFVWRSLLILILIALLSTYVFVMAQRAGRANAVNSWKAPRLATELVFAKTCELSPLLKLDNESGSLRLLKSTPNLYILFSRNVDPRTSPIMDMRLYRVPTACVSHLFTGIRRPAL